MQPLNVRHIADHALMFPVVHGFHALRRLPVSAAVILYQAYRFGVQCLSMGHFLLREVFEGVGKLTIMRSPRRFTRICFAPP